MLKLLRYLKGYRTEAVIAPLVKMLEAVGELIVPLLVASIIDVGIPAGDKGYIFTYGGIMLAVCLGGLGCSMICQYLAARASIGFGTNVRRSLMHKVNALPLKRVNSFTAGSLITRVNLDVTQTQMALAMFIRLVLRAPIIMVGSIIMAMTISPSLGTWFLVLALLVAVIMAVVMKITGKKYMAVQKSLDDVTTSAGEQLSGARVIRAFSKQEDMHEKFAAKTEALRKNSFVAAVVGAILSPATFALVNFTTIALLYFGAVKINAGTFSAGELIALINYLSQVLLSLVVMGNIVIVFTRATASAKRINEVLAAEEDGPALSAEGQGGARLIADKAEGGAADKGNDYAAVFDGVCFAYEGNVANTLKNLSFTVKRGERLGIIGSTASGKSTLVSLLPLLERPTAGRLEILGQDALSARPDDVRARVSIAPQGSPVFSGTLRENLAMANASADDAQMIAALQKADAWGFVSEKGGLDMVLVEGGKNLSGGQRQRVNIARALVRPCDILILDDVTSALDFGTEAKVLKNVLKSEATVIIISQRISAISRCDKIVVLDDGEAVGVGRHKELLGTCDKYAQIHASQV